MSRFLFPTSIRLASHGCLSGNSSIHRTAVCGPACAVVWEGRRGDSPPYPDCEGVAKMTKSKRGRYTLEFKQEAARLVESGQCQAAVSRSLGVVEQTLGNWVKAHRAGKLKGACNRPLVSAEQMEISRLRAELARVTMERDILGKATAFFAKGQR